MLPTTSTSARRAVPRLSSPSGLTGGSRLPQKVVPSAGADAWKRDLRCRTGSAEEVRLCFKFMNGVSSSVDHPGTPGM